MNIASSTVVWDSWQVCVVCPSGVEHSSLLTEFDPTLRSPGSREISGLCPRESRELPVPPSLPM